MNATISALMLTGGPHGAADCAGLAAFDEFSVAGALQPNIVEAAKTMGRKVETLLWRMMNSKANVASAQPQPPCHDARSFEGQNCMEQSFESTLSGAGFSARRERIRGPKRAVVAALLTAGGVLYGAAPASAKPDYTRRTNKPCTFCHPGPGWTLNDAGKYYRDHHYSLKGYEPKPATGHSETEAAPDAVGAQSSGRRQ
jgi:hypothetical protein